jgi:hypothetical protein
VAQKRNALRMGAAEEGESIWQARYYDFNVFTENRVEKLNYNALESCETWTGGESSFFVTGRLVY